MKQNALLIAFLCCSLWLHAAPGVITPNIRIDQFGYFPSSKKIAVIANPITGFNVGYQGNFNASTGANQYQVRRWSDDAVVFTGTITAWNSGATHAQSGDKGWWFDFTSVTTAGSYYIYDIGKNVGSYRFEINNNVYTEVLKHAMRTFFYQRINFAKTVPEADAKWADAACFERANQDRFATSRYDKGNMTTAKDLHGGWMDAGDYNKYVTFTFNPLCNLLGTYRSFPSVFRDDYNIPESGNGIPDILDEVKWELDWLKRMQDATGNGGLFLKVGVDNYNTGSPPSTDTNPRYYLGECTSSTLTGCAVFSLASLVYRTLGTSAMTDYADDLLLRAKNAWIRAKSAASTNSFTLFQQACDDQNIKAGDADVSVDIQLSMALTAAVYLYEATGEAEYKNFFEANYSSGNPYRWWGPYHPALQRAFLRYTQLPGVTPSVITNIITYKNSSNNFAGINDYNNLTDLYRSHLPDGQYHWGSNEVKGNAGIHNFDFVTFNINATQHATYKELGASYLHWFHGVNPMGRVMLSNMYAYGGDSCANEIYHAWFPDGSIYDNALTSVRGPVPGYVTGGPNRYYWNNAVTPPFGQPFQKAYKDWNTITNNEASWEITEPAIYTQAAYVSTLARVIYYGIGGLLPLNFLDFKVTAGVEDVAVKWQIDDATDVRHFEVERSFNGRDFIVLANITPQQSLEYVYLDQNAMLLNAALYYRIKAILHNGEMKYTAIQKVLSLSKHSVQIAPNPVTGTVSLRGFAKIEEPVVLEILNAKGVKVYEEQWQRPQGVFIKSISMEKFPAGVYWIKLLTKEGAFIERIIRQ